MNPSLPTPLLLALSGGADSVALLRHLLDQGVQVVAAHCNFHLRGAESDRDEAFVRDLCGQFGVPLHVAHFDTRHESDAHGESIEMTARRLRYGWFKQLCDTHGYAAVAVAHHSDDNAETLLLNLLRGTGLKGLCGMSPDRTEQGLRVIRPLLTWSRQEILAYLDRLGQPCITDSTNADTAYRRNKIRHVLLPLMAEFNPQIVRTLNDTARRLQEERLLVRMAEEALWQEFARRENGSTVLRREVLQHPACRTLIHDFLGPCGFNDTQLADLFAMGNHAAVESSGYVLTRIGETFVCRRKVRLPHPLTLDDYMARTPVGMPWQFTVRTCGIADFREADGSLHIPRDARMALLDADCIKGKLMLRHIAETDRFRPYGLPGTKVVNKYLRDLKMHRAERDNAVVLADDNGIVWVVNHRIDQRLAVTSATRHILQISSTMAGSDSLGNGPSAVPGMQA